MAFLLLVIAAAFSGLYCDELSDAAVSFSSLFHSFSIYIYLESIRKCLSDGENKNVYVPSKTSNVNLQFFVS